MRCIVLAPLCAAVPAFAQGLEIPCQTFTLDNGLKVVVHEDHSDPVVAVYVVYHVGSAREEPGRSGFAHLFEHMLFQGSQNVGDDAHFKHVQGAGGTLNGTTNSDRTLYYEVLPANQLELALWLESDRLGFLLPAMTQAKLDNQRDVVKNERRQNYENQPYAQTEGVIKETLYPPEHPYSWTTIGSMKDLSAATLDDVANFFKTWYVPNNATLAIGGDVQRAEVEKLVRKYFGGIAPGAAVTAPAPRPVTLAASRRVVTEDRVQHPQLTLVWPTVEAHHADDAPLDMLAAILSSNKGSVLDKALTIDAQLATQVSAGHSTEELAGVFEITLRPQPGVALDTLEARARELLAAVVSKGVDAEALANAKTVYEARQVRRLETVGSRTGMLAQGLALNGDPNHHVKTVARHLAVTGEDVLRVAREYLIDRPSLSVSTVPKGQPQLAAAEPAAERLAKEKARPARTIEAAAAIESPKTTWKAGPELDRTRKPAAGPAPVFRAPKLWHSQLGNGIAASGTQWKEAPLTTLSLYVPAGREHETAATAGLASLAAAMLTEGTKSLGAVEFDQRLDELGATLSARATDEEIALTLSCLDKTLEQAVALLTDVVLHPRFDGADFERLKKERLVAIDTRGERIEAVADQVFRRLLWGAGRVQGRPSLGTQESISAAQVADVREYWQHHANPRGARLVYVGSKDARAVAQLMQPLTSAWQASGAVEASADRPAPPPQVYKTTVYLVDKPGAPQSQLRIGHLGLAANDADYYPAQVLNYGLGGSFTSRINMNLRETHGYTYGARSSFETSSEVGAFSASAGVKTEVTKESVQEFMKELTGIRTGVKEEELVFTREAMTQSAAREYESTMALAGYVNSVSRFGWADDFAARRLTQLGQIKTAQLGTLAQQRIHPDRMLILVVGDKARVLPGLKELGYGEVIELDIDGAPLVQPAGPAAPATPAAK